MFILVLTLPLSIQIYRPSLVIEYFILNNMGLCHLQSACKVPDGKYSFYGGNLIFRGHFTASGEETSIVIAVQFGFAGGYSAWLNGQFLGSAQGSPSVSLSDDTWTIPSGSLRIGQDNVFVIVQGV